MLPLTSKASRTDQPQRSGPNSSSDRSAWHCELDLGSPGTQPHRDGGRLASPQNEAPRSTAGVAWLYRSPIGLGGVSTSAAEVRAICCRPQTPHSLIRLAVSSVTVLRAGYTAGLEA